ncbi:metalloregulator ArsR/SmtB family transcription factor [Leptospirillum ferriphilum]|nr:metalloregulator ArsR/SmtB family transcription factor [Leptospirillum ferriphilum]
MNLSKQGPDPDDDLFFALTHALRRRALLSLLERGPLCVCHLTEILGSSQPTVSRQMSVLRAKGLVEPLRKGQWIYYSLARSLPAWTRTFLTTLYETRPDFQNRSYQLSQNFCPVQAPTRLLFLCTQNACRSQISFGWARALGGAWVDVRSAGTHPHPDGVNPLAISVMRERGIDLSGQSSTPVDASLLRWANLVVTVCGEADESCPVLPPGVRKEHWPIPDPDRIHGSSREIYLAFTRTRDEIERRIRDLFQRLGIDILDRALPFMATN